MYVNIFSLIFLMILAVPVSANEKDTSSDVYKFDIKGIKFGMSLKEVLALFPDIKKTHNNDAFLTKDEQEKDQYKYYTIFQPEKESNRFSLGIIYLSGDSNLSLPGFVDDHIIIQTGDKNKNIYEEISVDFVNAKYGRGVIYVEYHFRGKNLSIDNLAKAFKAKYGNPKTESTGGWYLASYGDKEQSFGIYMVNKETFSLTLRNEQPKILYNRVNNSGTKMNDIKF